MFVDRVRIQVQGGRGGNGCVSFRREKYIPRGGPDGGDGGDGGSVVIVAEPGVDSLAALSHRRHWTATNGEPGSGANRHGRSAQDITLRVPPGTIVYDAAGGFVLKDLAAPGDSVIAARGGGGGKGNTRFKSSTNRAPREATEGDDGESRELVLELKVIADVGLIGKPNAGKSTLLSRLSRARPEIADYPFTTKFPNLGLVQFTYERSFVLADIPGLIEGAHAGHGLGHEFLRHIERAGILVHLVEPQPADGSDPVTNYRVIREELKRYNPALIERPEIVVISKAELPEAGEARQRLEQELGRPVLALSAVTGQGLDKLVQAVAGELDSSHRPQESSSVIRSASRA
ncbi:MAG TPA: GTPase ObgE [Pirellulales bacterium]|nr:GTPase ObgE [Pirellulales bacterium]